MSFEVSNPDRVLFPGAGFTKADIVEYYERIGAAMLPHVSGRPLTLERYPRGIGAKGFMQKNAAKHFPDFIGRIELPKSDGTTTYPLVETPEGIAYLANQGTITFHVWTSRLPDLWHADRLIMDLDPAEGDPAAARAATRIIGSMLDDLGITSAPMATGSKGYHVFAAIEPTLEADVLGLLSRQLAHLAAHAHPDLLTTEFRKENRKGRVFVDWLRNQPGSTGVAPWSLRPRTGAPVAVPITWAELETTAPDEWRLDTIDKRVGVDPILELVPQDLGDLIEPVARQIDDAGIVLATFDRFRS